MGYGFHRVLIRNAHDYCAIAGNASPRKLTNGCGARSSSTGFSLWKLTFAIAKCHRLKSSLMRSSRGILHRIGYGESESVGHNPELDGEASGRLSIDLNLDMGCAGRCALKGV